MKKFYLLTAAAVCALIAGCTPPEEEVIVTPPEQAYLAYFGFEAKEGVFAEDVKVESPATGTIRFETPVGTDAASYSDLVPVFAVTDTTAVVSDAEGNPIESGVAYDFSKDVDIYVTVSNKGGEKTSMYTISVQAKAALVWSLAAEAADSVGGDMFMKINPNDGLPYIAAKLNSDAGNYGLAYKFDSELKPVVGDSPVFLEEKVDKISLGFDKDGAVYTAFREYKVKNHTAVVKLADNAATFVGDSAAYQPYPNDVSAILPGKNAGSIWVASQAATAAGNIAKRTLSLSKWNGTSWETGITISANRPATEYSYNTIPVHSNGDDYLFIYNQNTASVSLYKLDDDAWIPVFESLQLNNANGDPMTDSANIYSSYSLDCDIASNGDIYICAGAQFVDDAYNVAVVRYRPSDKSQAIVGGVTSYLKNKDRYFSLALDANDTPYLAFRNNVSGEDKLYVQYIDNKTKTWSEAAAISNNAVGAITLRFNEEGKAYIATVNNDNKRVQIYTAN